MRGIDKKTVTLGAVAGAGVLAVSVSEFLKIRKKIADKKSKKATEVTPAELGRETTEVIKAGFENAPKKEQVLLEILSGFLIGGTGSRAIAIGIRDGWWPVENVHVQNRHIHHFVPGIILTNIAAFLGLMSQKGRVANFLFGLGLGMTLDEAALLLDLKDVYWTEEGLLSVQLSLAFLALLSGTVILTRIIERGEREVGLEEIIS